MISIAPSKVPPSVTRVVSQTVFWMVPDPTDERVAVGREGLSARLNVSTAEEQPEAESIAMTVY